MFYFWIFVFVTGIKIILIKSYYSTDFEVHRNWLAITHSLPISKWYVDATSQWTLDYPPFFGYFEWLLSQIAKYVDKEMLDVNNLNYASDETILFQRLTVIITDIFYVLGVKLCLNNLQLKSTKEYLVGAGLLLCNIGLLFVDHIHFQYNGFLFGILLLSIGCLLKQNYLMSAFLFAALVNFKHIFLYIAPAFGIFFCRFYCWERKNVVVNFLKLVGVAGLCIVLSFGPFIHQIPQVLSRLFPFKRGLTHAYWAPNFWALYNFADKTLTVIGSGVKGQGINTGGLVQDYKHEFLPEISPACTFLLTGLLMLPCLMKLLLKTTTSDSHKHFLQTVVICSCTSFMFGWHVHEKAILMVIIPLSLLALTNVRDAEFGFSLWFVGHYSLHPLLFNQELMLVKYSLILAYQFASYDALRYIYPTFQLKIYEILYFIGFIGLAVYQEIIQYLLFNLSVKLPFLPLLMTSVYCSLGISYFYIKYYYTFMLGSPAVFQSPPTKLISTKRKFKQK